QVDGLLDAHVEDRDVVLTERVVKRDVRNVGGQARGRRAARRAAVGRTERARARGRRRRRQLTRVVRARLEAIHRTDADAEWRVIHAARLEAVRREVVVDRRVRRVRIAAWIVVLPGVAKAGIDREVVALTLAQRELHGLVAAVVR